MLNTIGKIIVSAGIFLGSLFGYKQPVDLGAFNPTGGGTYRLQSSIGLSDTSLTLSSFKEPISNIPYTMNYLNSSIEYGTLEPSNATKKEFISFSTITQNSDGSATLGGVTRGLGFSYPYTASSTLQQTHSGQSIFILSNPPQLTNQYANKANNDTITGAWVFTSTAIPTYNSAPSFTTNLQIIDKQYADALAIAGAPDSNGTTKGLVEMATTNETASSTATGDTTAPLVPPNTSFSAQPTNSGYTIPVTRNNGKLDENFIATSTTDYDWARVGIATTSVGTELGVNGNAVIAATTTTGGLVATTTAVNIGGISYEWPGTDGADGTVLYKNNSKLDWVDTTATTTSYSPKIEFATNTAETVINTNTNAIFTQFFLPFKLTLNSVYFYLKKNTVNGTFRFGIYNNAGTLVTQNISNDPKGVAQTFKATTTSATILTPGMYYMGVVPTGTADFTFLGWNLNNDILSSIGQASGEPCYAETVTVSASTLPASIDPTTNCSISSTIFRLEN